MINVDERVENADWLKHRPRLLGGQGSGNFGHRGRPGQIGGSSSWNGPDPRRDVFQTFDFASQAIQFPEKGEPGISVQQEILGEEKKVDAKGKTHKNVYKVDIVLHRDDEGKMRGVLYHYPQGYPGLQEPGSVNVIVDPEARRQGIATKLLNVAESEWDIDLEKQEYTAEGRKFITSRLKRQRRILGGPGSGNFGHRGRPGQIGGSSGSLSEKAARADAERDKQQELADAQTSPVANPAYVIGIPDMVPQEDAVRYVKAYGQEFKRQKRPDDVELEKPNECYRNASLLVMTRPDLTYVEGWAMKEPGGLAVLHAWATDKDNNVIDCTIPDSETWHYFGVKYDRSKYLKSLYKAKLYGVLGSTDKAARKAIETGGNGLRADENLKTAGGPGSGNFGHVGRPGEVGGSGKAKAIAAAQMKFIEGAIKDSQKEFDEALKKYGEEVRGWGEDHQPLLANWGAKNAKDYVEKVEEKLTETLKDAKIFVRVNSGDLRQILSSGEIMNAFQTGRSHGGTTAAGEIDYARRQHVEERFFDIPQDAPGSERPKYGYLSSGDGITEMQEGTLMGAGGIAIELKPQLKERTTFTVGDSLDRAVTLIPEGLGGGWVDNELFLPVPVTKPSILAVPGGTRIYATKYKQRGSNVRIPTVRVEELDSDYVEAQIHGRIRTSDIKSVTFLTKPPAIIEKRLEKLGINVRIAKGKKEIKPRGYRRLESVDLHDLGGPGSGNFGHAGRPGEVGGSAPGNVKYVKLQQNLSTEGVADGIQMTLNEHQKRQLAKNMDVLRERAKARDFPLDKVYVQVYDRGFNVGGRSFTEAGSFSPQVETITMRAETLANTSASEAEAMFEHEVTHRDWHNVNKALGLEAGPPGWFTSHNAEKLQDIWTERGSTLEKDDGVSDYSRAYWKEVPQMPKWQKHDDPEHPWLDANTGELFTQQMKRVYEREAGEKFDDLYDSTFNSAVNETLAEISKRDVYVKYSYAPIYHHPPTEIWRELHSLVRTVAREVRESKQ